MRGHLTSPGLRSAVPDSDFAGTDSDFTGLPLSHPVWNFGAPTGAGGGVVTESMPPYCADRRWRGGRYREYAGILSVTDGPKNPYWHILELARQQYVTFRHIRYREYAGILSVTDEATSHIFAILSETEGVCGCG